MVQSRCFLCADCEDLGKSGQRNAQGAGSGNGGSLADQEHTAHGAHGFAVSGGVLQYAEPHELRTPKFDSVRGTIHQSIGRFDYNDGDNVQANSVGSKSDFLTRFRNGGLRAAVGIDAKCSRSSVWVQAGLLCSLYDRPAKLLDECRHSKARRSGLLHDRRAK